MSTLTDFSTWLYCLDFNDYEDVYALYHSIADCDEYGVYKTQVAKGKNNGWIVSSSCLDDTLHLISDKAKQTFLSIIESRYCEGMDIEGWYAYKQAMEKDD